MVRHLLQVLDKNRRTGVDMLPMTVWPGLGAKHRTVAAGLLLGAAGAMALAAPAPLPALGAAPGVTVSGLSSGGYMAAQYAVVYAKDVQGVGVVAGGPYDCAQGHLGIATSMCSCVAPPACRTPTPAVLAFQSRNRAEGKAALKLVDPLVNLKAQRVWLFTGGRDKTVPSANVEAIRLFYVDQMKTPASALRLVRNPHSGHGMPAPDAAGAVACRLSSHPFLNDCPLDAAGDLLQWLYPGTVARTPEASGRLLEFDQTAYTAGGEDAGLGDSGYVYVPEACTAADAACRVHVAFHGCSQARDAPGDRGGRFGDTFAADAGYNRWAAGSRIIVLYPQTRPQTNLASFGYQNNPRSCWDFWGYTRPAPSTSSHATNVAPQLRAVRAMVSALQQPR